MTKVVDEGLEKKWTTEPWGTPERTGTSWEVKNGPPGGTQLFFFQVVMCGPNFRSVGLANWYLPLKRGACELKISKFGGLWTENFQIWGLVSWKFPFGACELKFRWELRLLRLKFPNFLKRGSCELSLLLEMWPLRTTGEGWKGVFRAAHLHSPF